MNDNNEPLAQCVIHAMEQYFADMNGTKPENLYNFFIGEVEKPFLQVVMQHAGNNQSLAADMLGINRNTLRKKLTQYGLI